MKHTELSLFELRKLLIEDQNFRNTILPAKTKMFPCVRRILCFSSFFLENGLFNRILYSLADFCEHGEFIRSTLRPLENVARLVADEAHGRPTLDIVVLGDQRSPRVATTRTSIGNPSSADLRIRDHTVLDSNGSNVHLANLCKGL